MTRLGSVRFPAKRREFRFYHFGRNAPPGADRRARDLDLSPQPSFIF